jgi:hypothetical protein
MQTRQRQQSLRTHERRIARHNYGELGVGWECAPRNEHGIAAATLRPLQNTASAQWLDGCGDLLGLFPYDNNYRMRFQRLAGADNLFDKRPSPSAVQNLWQR